MKELIIIVAMALGITGCSGSQAQKPAESTKIKTEVTTQINEEATTTKTEKRAPKGTKWTDIVPDYKKIFKDAEITYESIIDSPTDDTGMLYVTMTGVTREQFEKYVEEAAKTYTNVQSKGSVDSTSFNYGDYTADDGTYRITCLLGDNLDNDDVLDVSIACRLLDK